MHIRGLLVTKEECGLVSNIQEPGLSTRLESPSLSSSDWDVVFGKDEVYVRKKTANVKTHDLIDHSS